ncbi:peptide chain release factor 2 [Candidatus Uhrbacteria bacterium RIFOXYB12_FULL_58_10]|uniref:Peptide chain release factor 2 n=1 Tax=Candidatus Uhrbacteria bacterium RIFOXYB2_FULL_57_15 TaxID=1802422 RepID=A0A1F7W6S5_9BACT|nr:MAG: peptide chain release factor 2 [Candidatus Uhrbacteria bacterium RIFOXYB12_FULL_58_10]OGL97814.1 MAG: peptide chain release factor 2 [Candidatus Uhrbacteria bacterium RIFOXYB2_FULL_57_15]OGL99939.1 MAG: peptide chain release factor 2 [Candidatus Uhrbacteria bacterium RIFOXYC12_FULL_57_11]
MTAPDFWSRGDVARVVSKRVADLQKEVAQWEDFLVETDELAELEGMARSEDDEATMSEVAEKLDALEKQFSQMEFTTLFSGSFDAENAIVSFHAGQGGTEANDWTAMLMRMVMRFCEGKEWDVQILDESRGEEVGYKSLTLRVTGRYAYGYLKSEAGVHRLVRISPFDAEKMRHTTFALIEVLPELEDVDQVIEIKPEDLRVDTFMAGGHGGQSVNTTYSAVRIVHLPTKISVQCQNERSQLQNRETAMKILRAKLLAIKVQERAKEHSELRGEYQSADWGNQIRSYVLQPYQLVKDHRTNHETSDTRGVLDGDLEPFMEAYLRERLSKKT